MQPRFSDKKNATFVQPLKTWATWPRIRGGSEWFVSKADESAMTLSTHKHTQAGATHAGSKHTHTHRYHSRIVSHRPLRGGESTTETKIGGESHRPLQGGESTTETCFKAPRGGAPCKIN